LNLFDFVRVYKADHSQPKQLSEAVKAIQDWKQHGWYDVSTGTAHSEPTKELLVRNLGDQPEILKQCREWIGDALEKYMADVDMPARVTKISNPRLNKYPTGTIMRRHADHIHSLFDGEEKGIPVLSFVGLINEEFLGGRFIVRDRQIDLKAGDVLVFPSCFLYPHEVTEVTEGERFSFVSWAY
jgi:predicted 2-oxoglutarate/Fe(II)-dependent dioxygenase YbiX